ncbi:MAG: hypothetical protein ACHQCE_00970 [Streptosporangiales bacterium]
MPELAGAQTSISPCPQALVEPFRQVRAAHEAPPAGHVHLGGQQHIPFGCRNRRCGHCEFLVTTDLHAYRLQRSFVPLLAKTHRSLKVSYNDIIVPHAGSLLDEAFGNETG